MLMTWLWVCEEYKGWKKTNHSDKQNKECASVPQQATEQNKRSCEREAGPEQRAGGILLRIIEWNLNLYGESTHRTYMDGCGESHPRPLIIRFAHQRTTTTYLLRMQVFTCPPPAVLTWKTFILKQCECSPYAKWGRPGCVWWRFDLRSDRYWGVCVFFFQRTLHPSLFA